METSTKARTGSGGPWASLALLGVVLALGWLFLRAGSVDGGEDLVHSLSREEASREAPSPRDVASELEPARRAIGPSSGVASGTSPEPASEVRSASRSEAWRLVSGLRGLASDARSFHARALPVIERLTRVVGETEGTALVSELSNEVVWNGEEGALVRGAVLLALSALLPVEGLSAMLDRCFLEQRTPNELLRAAVLAAALRGEESYCSSALDLGAFASLPLHTEVELPGLYPLRLERVVDPHAAGLLETWLAAGDPRDDYFRVSEERPAPETDLASLGDYFVTSELLFLVWGQRALLEPRIEEVVLAQALPGSDPERFPRSLIHLRAANFLVHSLALCSERMFDLAEQLGTSEDPATSSLARSMGALSAGGLGVALVARLETLRVSNDPDDELELELTLAEVAERMGALGSPSSKAAEEAAAYLDGLVQDTSLSVEARALALRAVVRGGSWSALCASVERAFRSRAPDLVCAVAAGSLVRVAGGDEARRARAREILEQARLTLVSEELLSDLERYLAELTR